MNTKKQRINIITLGCSKNTVDSEQLAGMFPTEQYIVRHESSSPSDVVIINTCGFIGDAKEESVNTILAQAEAVKQRKNARLIVMGCLSQRYQNILEKEIPEVNAYFGANDLRQVANYLGANRIEGGYHYKRKRSGAIHYAYLKISEGCDRNCSFCAIPFIRGKHHSVPMEELLEEADYLAKKGVKELILIAQDLTYYGLDIYKERRLVPLIQALSEIAGIEWIRLQYTYPHGFPEELIRLIATNPKVCKYIDLPLQHINSGLLHSMKRNIDRSQTLDLIGKIRKTVPDIAFRTTLIVGYPGETEEVFRELREFVRTQRFDRLGVFTYSAEEGTAAYQLKDDIPEEVKQQRLETIMEIQQQISLELNQERIGKTEKVLVDRLEGEYYIARTQYDSPEVDNEVLISAATGRFKIGSLIKVVVEDADYFDLFARPL